MTLTVPQAPISGGARAPQVRADESAAGGLGQAAAVIGQSIEQTGSVLEGRRLSIERDRLQIDLRKDLDDAVLDVQSMDDPTQINSAWQERLTSLRSKYEAGDPETGRAAIDPKLAPEFANIFDSMALGPTQAVQRHEMAMGPVYAQRLAVEQSFEAADESGAIIPEQVLGHIERRKSVIEGHIASGLLTPEQGATQINEMREKALQSLANSLLETDPAQLPQLIEQQVFDHLPTDAQARLAADTRDALIAQEEAAADALEMQLEREAIGLVARDPQLFLDKDADGDFARIDGVTRQRWSLQAEANLKRAADAQEREEEAAAREREAQIGKDLDLIISGTGVGMQPDNLAEILNNPAYQDHPKFPVALAKLELAAQHGDLSRLSLPRITELIEAERNTGLASTTQVDRVAALEAIAETTEQGWQGDQIAYAGQIGLPVPELDLSSGETFGAGLSARLRYAESLAQGGYTENPRLFSDAEREALADVFAPEGDTSQQAEMLAAIVTGSGSRAGAREAMVELDLPLDLQHLAGMGASGVSPAVVERALQGRKEIALGNVIEASQSERLVAALASLGDLYADVPQGFEAEAATRRVADLIYAANLRRGGASISKDDLSAVSSQDYERAIHAALGGTGNPGGRDQAGGVYEVFGADTILPPGLAASSLDQALDRLDQRRLVDGPKALDRQRQVAETAFAAASLSGGLPSAPGLLDSFDTLAGYRMQAIGTDRYVLVRDDQDGLKVAADPEGGGQFVFSLRAFVQALNALPRPGRERDR